MLSDLIVKPDSLIIAGIRFLLSGTFKLTHKHFSFSNSLSLSLSFVQVLEKETKYDHFVQGEKAYDTSVPKEILVQQEKFCLFFPTVSALLENLQQVGLILALRLRLH